MNYDYHKKISLELSDRERHYGAEDWHCRPSRLSERRTKFVMDREIIIDK